MSTGVIPHWHDKRAAKPAFWVRSMSLLSLDPVLARATSFFTDSNWASRTSFGFTDRSAGDVSKSYITDTHASDNHYRRHCIMPTNLALTRISKKPRSCRGIEWLRVLHKTKKTELKLSVPVYASVRRLESDSRWVANLKFTSWNQDTSIPCE